MKEMMNEVNLKFEMSHEEIEEFIKNFKEKRIKINSHDIARIHAHVSPDGGNCKECDEKVKEAGIITDFNEGLEDKDE